MPQYGSSQNLISTNLSQTVDNQGNPIISSDTGFAASPLGYAARAQALFGLPNSTFELTPPDTTAVISAANPLPYWDVQDYSSGVMSGSAIYDSTTNSWGVNLNPGTADTGDYITMTTRSYLINDSNLSLRQQALAVVSKVGTYAGTTQWNLELTAAYYDLTNTLLHSGTVATIYDNTTWTSMAGTTTTGGTAISASAHYVDLQFKLLATAPVTSATSVTIKSCLLQTSSGGGGAQSFLIAETFTTSTTWTRPAGVEYATLVLVGGGGGGSSGGLVAQNTSGTRQAGGGGGAGGGYLYLPNLYIGDADTYTISVGAGGSGGTANVFTKVTTGTALSNQPPRAASAGGTTSFGTAYWAGGGGASNTQGNNPTYGIAGTAGSYASVVWGTQLLSLNGGNGVDAPNTSGNINAGTVTPTTFVTGTWTKLPYQGSIAYPSAGSAGGNGVIAVSGTPNNVGTAASNGAAASGSGYFCQGAGAAGYYSVPASGFSVVAGTPSSGQAGAGGGGGVSVTKTSNTAAGVTWRGTAGNGGNAAGTSGAGGGGGGPVHFESNSSTNYNRDALNLQSGAGGNGGQGYAIVITVQ